MKKISILSLLLIFAFPFAKTQAASNDVSLRTRIVKQAYNFLETPYRYGGTERTGMDCSGLVYRVFYDIAGERLPRQVDSLYAYGKKIYGNLVPGDLVFFNTTGRVPSHVGIYIGKMRFIHAASEGRETGVIISSLSENYYKTRMLEPRRIIPLVYGEIELKVGVGYKSRNLERYVPSGLPLRLYIHSEYPESQFIIISFLREGNFLFSRRIRLNTDNYSLLWFIPAEGNWQISIEDQERVIRNTLSFSAGRDQ